MKILKPFIKQSHLTGPFMIIIICLLLSACRRIDNGTIAEPTGISAQLSPDNSPTPMPESANISPEPTEAPTDQEAFSWISEEGMTLVSRINPPQGYSRITSEEGELAYFIRSLPLKSSDSQLMLYDGRPKFNQNNYVAVFDLSLGDRDLQQCADSLIRIYAEYYWSLEEYDQIAFHLTNGFLMEYTKWREGYRIKVEGNDVSWVKSGSYDASYEEFLRYLNMVYAYAGTLSLSKECKQISTEELLPGDMFIKGGSPGHCVLVVDMAADPEGNLCYLLAQGYMPAQDFHVLKNPLHPEDPWYYASELSYPIDTPEWRFVEGSAARWREFPLKGQIEPIANVNGATDSIPAWAPAAGDKETSDNSLTLLAVGDNLIHIEVVQSGKQADGSLNYNHLYSNLKDKIAAADIAVVNQETILGGDDFAYSGYPNFNSPTEIGDALVETGFDVVLHATNHTMDKGLRGIENTLAYWKTKPQIRVLGINETEQASEEVPIIEKNGIKLAMLNYTYSLNGYKLPKDKPYLVNLLDKDKMKQDIEKAEKLADFTIVFPHWGSEYVYEATSMQKELTDFFYEQGVDLVIGAHPHVLEPVEWINTKPEHQMLVYYSLGNFLSYQKEAPRMLGGMAELTITKDETGVHISDAAITPIVTHYEHGPADFNYAIYKLTDYTPTLSKLHGVSDIAKNGAMDYQTTYELAKKVLGSWFTK
jgi:poly-gamma-glutamate capsule biosynthesis protein CapA/YwtB (metallophosphatase superfamily)